SRGIRTGRITGHGPPHGGLEQCLDSGRWRQCSLVVKGRTSMGRVAPLSTWLILTWSAFPIHAAELAWITAAPDQRGFIGTDGKPFAPLGFNYDHDEKGRLLDDYWDGEWPKVERDFGAMRDLGANVVRIHLQFAKFMRDRGTPNANAL